MRFDSRDRAGIALLGAMLALLVVHGREAHLQSHVEVATPGLATSVPAAEPALALIDFNVVAGQETLTGHVVLIRGNRVVEVAPVGASSIPPDARRVDGRGQRWLMMGEPGSELSPAPLAPGSPADLLVLAADPRIDPAVSNTPLAVVSGGSWEASRPPVSSAGVLGLPRR